MAYFARKQGEDAFSKKITRKNTTCFVCNNSISKGAERYISNGSYNSLCLECYNTWMKEGGRLGDISRNNSELKF